MEQDSIAPLEFVSESFLDKASKFIAIQEQNIDLARAMGDKETLIKEQIKMEVMKTAVSMFEGSVTLAKQRIKHV